MTPRTSPERARPSNESGAALILVMLLVLTISALAASMVTLSQTETYATMNYRTMTQVRYGAESGVHKAANYLVNTYVPPGAATIATGIYSNGESPVRYNGEPVVLSGDNVTANYPDADVQLAFRAAANGMLPGGTTSVSYQAHATMVSMVPTSTGTAVTWLITATGQIPNIPGAKGEVETILERQVIKNKNTSYAAFATAATCGALTVNSASTDSYDSTAALGADGKPVLAPNDGSVGTNGNLNASNNAKIKGTLSTPNPTGKDLTKTCDNDNVSSVTLKDESYGQTVTGGPPITLAQTVILPIPPMPNPLPPILPEEVGEHETTTFPPGDYGNFIKIKEATIHFSAGTYNVNSIEINDHSKLILDSGPVIINIVGSKGTGTGACGGFACIEQPFWLNSSASVAYGGGVNKWDPAQLTINYAGTGRIRFDNDAETAAQINAPNGPVVVNSSDFFGSIIGSTVTLGNAAKLHFDRHLGAGSTTYVTGEDMLTSFTWKKY